MTATTGGESPSSLGGLFLELVHEIGDLVGQEIALAQAEITEKVSEAGRGGASLAIGGAVVFAGLWFLLLAIDHALELVVPAWAAALIVGLVTTALGAGLLWWGRQRFASGSMHPSRTLESLQQHGRWAEERMGRNGHHAAAS